MLTKFRVENFKSFDKPLTFDLAHPGNYEFNAEAVQDGVVTKGIVYGFNGCGKSNLGLAMLDIVTHLTDTQRVEFRYPPYLNLDSGIAQPAKFEYQFRFDGIEVIYRYQKKSLNALLTESLSIGGAETIYYDFNAHSGFVRLQGAETLNLNAGNSNISRVKFVNSNAILTKNDEKNDAFQQFMDFVNRMLLFYSLNDGSFYQGYRTGSDSLAQFIIERDKVGDFERFLQENNVNLHLDVTESIHKSEKVLIAKFNHGTALFWDIVSTGTKAMTLFYYWQLMMKETSFIFMDEFDAFYHFELAENVVKMLLKSFPKTQVIFTTHNTDLLSNDILRPDCYFWLNDSSIKPLCDLTDKDIRKAHNLQKMFKAGAFQEGGDYA